ncbi:MAG: DoxX family protein [Candidatus Marinamargulisbacteria bacterium]
MHLFLLRLCAGGLMLAFHGWPKWQKFDQLLTTFPDPIGLGSAVSLILVIFAEAICSIFIMTGTYVRLACIPPIITMLVAAFIVHANDPISTIELPIMYLVMYIAIFNAGPGKWAFQPIKWRPKSNLLTKLFT